MEPPVFDIINMTLRDGLKLTTLGSDSNVVIKGNEEICSYPKVQEKLNLLEESVTDDMEHLETSKDEDAKTGHKTY